jgi:hypothetical protein
MTSRRCRSITCALLVTVGSGLAATAGTPSAGAATNAAGSFASQAGDYVGQGRSIIVNDFVVRKYGQSGFQFWQPSTPGWNILITPPKGQQFSVGTYRTERMQTDSTAGLDFGGDGRGCNTSNGTLWIDDIATDPGGEPTRLAIRIEQHCEGVVPALYGSAVTAGAATQPVQPPTAPVAPPPPPPAAPGAGLATPGAGAAAPVPVSTDAIPPENDPVPNARVGTCATVKKLAGGVKLIPQSCSKPHRYEVSGSWLNAFPTRVDAERAQLICSQKFAVYVGTPAISSTLNGIFLFPSASSWARGDRALVCLVGRPSGNLTARTIKGSNL